MKVTVDCGPLCGRVSVCSSKSEAHRLLICALLSFSRTEILCGAVSEDISATVNCIRAAGASVTVEDGVITVDSSGMGEIIRENNERGRRVTLDCGESGSTLRFIIPVAGALGLDCVFTGRGRLPERPNRPLIKVLSERGCEFDREDGLPLASKGQLAGGVFEIPGNISSQYISGLLFALPLLCENSVIKMTEGLESKPYIMITLEALERFGVSAEFDESASEIRVKGGQRYVSPGVVRVNGDWSNGAFWLAAAELSGQTVVCDNLSLPTKQGDSVITDIIKKMNVKSGSEDGQKCDEHVIIDASQFPDLVPIISVLAAARKGRTTVCGAARLKIKESNRIESVADMIKALGGEAVETDDGIIVEGKGELAGGTVNSCGDHRIVMSAAVAALICKNSVTILRAEAVNKSYPAFFEELSRLGAKVERSDY